jgi:small-conductance mechanosensitive channel
VLYAVVAVLFVTGAAWIALDRAVWPETSTSLLRLHGGAAMAMLVLLGALLPVHARVGWRRGKNQASGLVMLAVNTVLVVTAFGLYYTGSEVLRRWTSELHILVGFALPLLVAGHVLLGRRARRAGARERPATRRQGL